VIGERVHSAPPRLAERPVAGRNRLDDDSTKILKSMCEDHGFNTHIVIAEEASRGLRQPSASPPPARPCDITIASDRPLPLPPEHHLHPSTQQRSLDPLDQPPAGSTAGRASGWSAALLQTPVERRINTTSGGRNRRWNAAEEIPVWRTTAHGPGTMLALRRTVDTVERRRAPCLHSSPNKCAA
jgi:hypothetical protein